MSVSEPVPQSHTSDELTEAAIRVGLIAFMVIVCAWIFAPFAELMLWAAVLAIALYPLHQRLAKFLRDRQSQAASLLVVAGLLLLGGPTIMLGNSFANHVKVGYTAYENNELALKAPDPKVADWPLVGPKVYSAWSAAADNLPAFLKQNQEPLKNLSKRALSAVASTAGSVLLFLASLIIAGFIMAYGRVGSQAARAIFKRLAGPVRGPRLQHLATETVRSVANGVIGVAFIQALLLGIGFVLAGIPAAGVLALLVMLLGIAQLPAALISLPAIAYLWWSGDGSAAGNVAFTIYLLIAGIADNVLKPLLLGRGVDAPMPVILLGALGGMITSGIIGLFAGAVLLTVGYKVFMEWVGPTEEVAAPETEPEVTVTGHELPAGE